MAGKKKKQVRVTEILNKRARHKYHIGEKYEAGIKLLGTEVKAIREGKAQITESYVRIDKGEAFLCNAHIQEYTFGNFNNHAPNRIRKLLLNKKEILRMQNEVEAGGKTLIPLRIFLRKGLIKLDLAVCSGKNLQDKRYALKADLAKREADRAMKQTVYR
jgi:SsrA-binding protein